jgi:ribulose-phosphate 3-epimerase
MRVTPAVLPQSFEEIISSLFKIEGLAKRVQIDVCDGKMGIERTWLPHVGEVLPDGFEYEFDVMLYMWQFYVPIILTMGVRRIVMHVDTFTDEDFTQLFAVLAPYDVTLGLAVSNTFDSAMFIALVQKVLNIYPKLFVQVMGIRTIGAQGQPFDEEVLSRIALIKKHFPTLSIQVDGSMHIETAQQVKEVGADTVIVGSYIFGNNDVKKAIKTLEYSVS